MADIMALRGILAENKRKFRNKRLEGKGIILLMNELINPYEDEIEKRNAAQIKTYAEKLEQLVDELKELKEKIEAMESDLNG